MKSIPFSGIAEPEQLGVITHALESFCREAGIAPGTAAYEDAAWLVMTLLSSGMSTTEELSSALANSLFATQRFGVRTIAERRHSDG